LGDPIRVLHVDDDRPLLELTKHFMEQSGELIIDSAVSGSDAKEMFNQKVYDAIISDFDMPETNGLDLLQHVRKTDQKTPFLFFSDQRDEEVVINALTSGADFFLPKGVQVRSRFLQLHHAVRESVMRRRAEQETDRVSSLLRVREAAVRSSLCAVTLCDAEGRVQYANPASLSLWGYTDENDVMGRPASDFVTSPVISPGAIPELLAQRTWSGQATARRRDGTTFDIRVYVSTLTDDSGTHQGFVASFTDLSRQMHTRARLASYIRDIRYVSEKANEMTEIPLDGDIFGFIADAISSLAGPGAIVFLNSIHDDSSARVEAVRGTDIHLREVEALIGRPLVGLAFRATEEGFSSILAKSLIEIEGGISIITFGQFPAELSRKIEELPYIGTIYGSGFFWKGKMHGITAIILPPGSFLENIEVLDLFIRHCSAVLQQRDAEKMLREMPHHWAEEF
jgi:PAS domain S-box-containing protein